jgi:murein DD-endopeptidase MepM/ murein hydrolase activator NlpD
MGRPTLLVAVAILSVFLWLFVPFNLLNQHLPWLRAPEKPQEQTASPPSRPEPPKKTEKLSAKVEVPFRKEDGVITFKLSDLKEKLRIDYDYDAKEGLLTIRQGKVHLTMLREAPVLSRNGVYLPVEAYPIIRKGEIRIPSVVVEEGLGRQVEIREEYALIEQNASVPAMAEPKRLEIPKGDARGLIDYLSFLDTPIQGARVSTKDSHLPGAPRPYRNGVHEGLDYYSWTSRISIDSRTPVIAVADGVVVRADHDYQEMSEAERNRYLQIGFQNGGQTPQYILDKMRGRSVWIQHEKGVLSRYCHLSRIHGDITVGKKVKKGEVVGYVGNSGTSDGAKRSNSGMHLHLDLFIYGEWLWDDFTPAERRHILQSVLDR